jgi:hypothetical protein
MTADPESGSFLYSLNSDVSNITLEGVSVENNQADYFIAGHEGQFRLQDCIITNNSFELNQ